MKPAFGPAEIDTVHAMHAAGCSLKSIAASLGRSKSGVARYIPGEDSRNRWDKPPRDRTIDLYARWQARMPALRAAIKDDIKKIVS